MKMDACRCKGSTTGVSARTPLRIVGHWSEILHKMRVSDSTGEPGEVGEGPTFLSIADGLPSVNVRARARPAQ